MSRWLFALALILTLAACSREQGDPSKTLRLRYWGDLEEIRILSGMIKDFEAAHPGIKVKDERKPAGAAGYSEILLTEFAAGKAPDVIFCVAEVKDLLAENGLLEDLDPFLEKDAELKKSDYYPSLVRRFSSDGKLQVLPRDIAPFACVYYNKDLFRKAGVPFPKDSWRWEDLRQAGIKLSALKTEKGEKVFGFSDDWPMLDAWILSSGGKVVDDYERPSRLVMDSPMALRGILMRWDLMFTDQVMPKASDQQAMGNSGQALFMNNRLGMFYSGSWKIPEFRRIEDFDWDVAMFPAGPEGKRGFASGGSGFAMRKGVKNPQLAWELIRHMAGPEGQSKVMPTGLFQPALKSLAPHYVDEGKPANKKMLLEAVNYGVHPPATTAWLKVEGDVFAPILGQIWIPGFKREGVAAKVKEAVDKANRKYFNQP